MTRIEIFPYLGFFNTFSVYKHRARDHMSSAADEKWAKERENND